MAIYFLTEPYDKAKIGKKLEKIGFEKLKLPNPGNYKLKEHDLIVNFTDFREGRYQIQSDKIKDVIEKGKDSKYFAILETLADILRPKKILDDVCKEVFPELIR